MSKRFEELLEAETNIDAAQMAGGIFSATLASLAIVVLVQRGLLGLDLVEAYNAAARGQLLARDTAIGRATLSHFDNLNGSLIESLRNVAPKDDTP